MKIHSALVVGAGQAGLAISRALSRRHVDHLVLERGSVANSWKTERWDSLTTLTPNWANGLPGAPYDGTDRDGYMHVSELIARLGTYADQISAPVQGQTNVLSVSRIDLGFRVETDRGPVVGKSLVIATGACTRAHVPGLSTAVPAGVVQTNPARYRRPSDLPDGRVLVVGASASGVQIARELARAGREVTIAVGSHMRLPRRYRGLDIEDWLDRLGLLDERADQIDDLVRARRLPSPQIQGGPDPVDLNALQQLGVRVTGRLVDLRDGSAIFSGGLSASVKGADLKMTRLLDQIDGFIVEHGLGSEVSDPERPDDTRLPEAPGLSIPLGPNDVRSIVWATGFRPALDWLSLPVFDRRGRLMHRSGTVALPGIYAMGLPILRKRRSHQISGVAEDAEVVSGQLRAFLDGRTVAAA